MQILEASGMTGIVLLSLLMISIGLSLRRLRQIRSSTLMPKSFLTDFEARLDAHDYRGAWELAEQDQSPVARVLHSGLSRLHLGYEESLRGVAEQVQQQRLTFATFLLQLVLIALSAPLLGIASAAWRYVTTSHLLLVHGGVPREFGMESATAYSMMVVGESLIVMLVTLIVLGPLAVLAVTNLWEVERVAKSLLRRFSQVAPPAKQV